MLNVISRAIPEHDYTVRLVYSNGETFAADFKPLIRRGGVLAALHDPEVFGQVSVGEGGRYIEWPGGVDFCADALWLEAHPQEALTGASTT